MAAQFGSPGASGELAAYYRQHVLRLLLRMRGMPADDAEDLTHDILEEWIEAKHGLFRGYKPSRSKFRAYLQGYLHHQYADWCKARMARPPTVGLDHVALLADPAQEMLSEGNVTDEEYNRAVIQAARETFAAELQSSPLAVELLPYVEMILSGKQAAASAERFGKTVGAIRTALTRLRQTFRAHLSSCVRATCDDNKSAKEELTHILASAQRHATAAA
jgi:DNA-directed RNA polymerase specialized sigma24 family protein